MQRYTAESYAVERGEREKVDMVGMSETCSAVISAVQCELARLEPGPISLAVAHELVVSEVWALGALANWKGHAAAKREQIRLANGRPLAICRGTESGREVVTPLGTYVVHGEGCLCIFEAPTRASGRLWPHLCPACRPRNGKRQPLREAERRLRRRIDDRLRARATEA